MPTRLIREGIITSDRVDALDWSTEVFYRRLLNKVDDYGLADARPNVLRVELFTLRVDKITEAHVVHWLKVCQAVGLIALYETSGKPYLMVLDTRWQVRGKPKCPLPTEDQLHANAALSLTTFKQSLTVVYLDVDVDVDVGVVKTKALAAPKNGAAPHNCPPLPPIDQPTTTPMTVSTRAKRLGKDWVLPDAWRQWALTNKPGWNDATVARVAEMFRDFWVSKSGQGATKHDWEATWRNWVRKQDERGLPGPRLSTAGAKTAANLRDWTPPEERH